ncbi:hypoxanthine phosphoribosyltransferase [Ructibacterium gallinarum]|nr:hypoxanthine phosphoribosyltransferase [Ructibacterium gallinarum]
MTQSMRVGEILLTQEQINRRVTELAEAVNRDYPGGDLIVIGILKGCFVFISDLVRQLSGDVQIYFMQVSSYGNGTVSSGTLKIQKDIEVDIAGKNVLLAEDIVDSGHTLSQLVPLLKKRNPKSIRVCALLSKPSRRQVAFEADYTGFEIPDKFIVGYGLDCGERFRQLPYIAEVELGPSEEEN